MERLIDIFARADFIRASGVRLSHDTLELKAWHDVPHASARVALFSPAFELPVKFCRGETRVVEAKVRHTTPSRIS